MAASDRPNRLQQTTVVRVARPKDQTALKDFFNCLSPESRRRRFASTAPPSPEIIASLCNDSDPHTSLTLVIRDDAADEPRIIATATYAAHHQRTAEVAFAVEDAYQNKGLGTLLFRRLARSALRNGFTHLWAFTQIDNRSMQHILREAGYPVQESLRGTELEMDLSLVPEQVEPSGTS